MALFAGSPAATIAVITITAMSIFAALPNFWTVPHPVPHRCRRSGRHCPDQHRGQPGRLQRGIHHGQWLKDWTGSYTVPMFVVGGFMILSAILMVLLARRGAPNAATAPVQAATAEESASAH